MPNLYIYLIGCSPVNRNTEQHDVFFAIGTSIKETLPDVVAFWPEAKGKLHFDAWRIVNNVNGYKVFVTQDESINSDAQLFFINLGGYKQNEFEEFHYKMLIAAKDKGEAIQQAKKTAFYKHTGFKGAGSHIDDKYGIDVDDVYEIKDILPVSVKNKYHLVIKKEDDLPPDHVNLGYFKLDMVDKWSGDR